MRPAAASYRGASDGHCLQFNGPAVVVVVVVVVVVAAVVVVVVASAYLPTADAAGGCILLICFFWFIDEKLKKKPSNLFTLDVVFRGVVLGFLSPWRVFSSGILIDRKSRAVASVGVFISGRKSIRDGP